MGTWNFLDFGRARIGLGAAACVLGTAACASAPDGAPADDDALVNYARLRADSLVAARGDRSCALRAGKLLCWGQGYAGMSTTNTGTLLGMEYGPRVLARFPGVVQHAALGSAGGCGLVVHPLLPPSTLDVPDDGKAPSVDPTGLMRPEAYCWGTVNLQGTGIPGFARTTDNPEQIGDWDMRIAANDLTGALWMGANDDVLCATSVSGGLRCTSGGVGELPIPELAGKNIQQVVLAAAHRCASDGTTLWCWGDNKYGQLGLGDRTARKKPTPVPGLSGKILRVVAGSFHTCATTSVATYCFGQGNVAGQPRAAISLTELTPDVLSPKALREFPGAVTSIAAGFDHSCAIWNSKVYCWGDNAHLQVGDARESSSSFTFAPYAVPGIAGTPLEVVAGIEHSCVRTTEGVMCWGSNTEGQLGTGDRKTSKTAAPQYVREKALSTNAKI